jgi:hypothetical protein
MDGDQSQVVDKDGERGRNRTFNLLIKSQLLCQLSYAPTVGIWLVGRTEIIASDRLFSQSDALIHLEDLFSTILPYIRTIQQIFSAASMTARRIQSFNRL